MSDALDKPCRSRTEAALDVAIAALKNIATEPPTRSLLVLGNEARRAAYTALDRIDILLKETARGD